VIIGIGSRSSGPLPQYCMYGSVYSAWPAIRRDASSGKSNPHHSQFVIAAYLFGLSDRLDLLYFNLLQQHLFNLSRAARSCRNGMDDSVPDRHHYSVVHPEGWCIRPPPTTAGEGGVTAYASLEH
jgi:hypothetical protein